VFAVSDYSLFDKMAKATADKPKPMTKSVEPAKADKIASAESTNASTEVQITSRIFSKKFLITVPSSFVT